MSKSTSFFCGVVNFLFFILFTLSSFLLTSCATHQSRLLPAQQDLRAGKCDSAIHTLEDLASKAGDDRLLYLMEYGSALQICKDFKKSNQILLEADKLSEQIDYISASRVLGATLLNEEMIQYKGDAFEKLFVNASAALNFIELEQFDEAMVEVRRINEKYNKFSAEDKNSYELNSFSQYLSGLLWDIDYKFDDACIAFKAAYKLDPTYREVGLDALTACWKAKRFQEYDQLALEIKPTNEELKYIRRKNKNEKVIIYLQGLGPKKLPRPEAPLYPYLVPNQNLTQKLMILYQGENKNTEEILTKTSQSIYSVVKAATATQEADYNSLSARRLGARVAKEVMADQIRQKDKTLGNIAWLVMVASERADLRNWSLLPESIQIIRFNPREKTKIKLIGLNQFGEESETLSDIDLSLHEKKKIYLIRTIK